MFTQTISAADRNPEASQPEIELKKMNQPIKIVDLILFPGAKKYFFDFLKEKLIRWENAKVLKEIFDKHLNQIRSRNENFFVHEETLSSIKFLF